MFHRQRIVIYTPPKAGSTSLKNTFPWNTHIGFVDNFNELSAHTNKVVPGTETYHKYCVVRDPAERFKSLYKHYCHYERNIPFDVFVDWRSKTLHPFYAYTIAMYMRNIRLDGLIQLENLSGDFQSLNLDFTHIRWEHRLHASGLDSVQVPESWIESDIPKGIPYVRDVDGKAQARYV